MYSDLALTDCVFSDNHAEVAGGAIWCRESDPVVTRCTFRRNGTGTGGKGGALTTDNYSRPAFTYCTFERNSASLGGCVAADGNFDEPSFANCVFWANTAGERGGALYHNSYGTSLSVRQCTFSGNAAPAGSAVSVSNGALTVDRCILAFGAGGDVVQCAADRQFSCTDLFGNANGDSLVCSEIQPGRNGNLSADPRFREPENGDFFLKPDSPCLPGNHPDGADCGVIGIDQPLTVTATSEQDLYQNGVEAAHLTVTTRRNWGAGAVHLAVDLEPSLGPPLHMGEDTFALGPGEEHVSAFSWPVPDSSYAWEFDGTLTLAELPARVSVVQRVRAWFRGNPVPPPIVRQHQETVFGCFTPEHECLLRLVAMVPVAGRLTSLALVADKFCEAAAFARAGQGGRSDAAFKAGVTMIGKEVMREALFALVEAGVPVTSVVRILHGAGEYARSCMNGKLADYLRWIPEAGPGVPPGPVVDSLASWMATGLDSTGAAVADALFLEGHGAVRIAADSTWASADSLGLVFASVDPVDTLATVALTTRQVHSFLRTEEANPHSAATFRVRSLAAQPLNVGVLHATAGGDRLFLRYAAFPVTDRTVLTLSLADDQEVFPLLIDLDGDGQTDEVRYPMGTAGQLESAAPPRTLQLLLNRPNPFNPTTVIAFVLPERGHATLSIYDASGRLVARPFDQVAEPGPYEVVWDGRTTGGSEAPSGVYFYRVESGGTERMRRMVLTK